MDTSAIALIAVSNAARREVTSALPDAPTVYEEPRAVDTPRAARLRLALASGLRRTATAIEPVNCSPVL